MINIETAIREIGRSTRTYHCFAEPTETLREAPFAESIERIKRELMTNPDLPNVQLQVLPQDLLAD
jgi:hypothetical protein